MAEVVDESKNKPELSNISVKLDENSQPISQEKPKDEPKYVRLEDLEKINQAINNTREWNNRKVGSLEAKIDQLLKGAPQPVKPNTPPTEWDEKLQKDWKGTVEELAEQRVQKILQAERERQIQETELRKSAQLLEDNKRKVLERHKDLNDETSQKADVYRAVLQEHPEYLTNPFGPVLAMRDMEDRLRENGVLDEPNKQVVEKEVLRRTRTNGSAVPQGTSPAGTKTITLTKEQKELCDINGWKYENYAKYANMLANKKEVEA